MAFKHSAGDAAASGIKDVGWDFSPELKELKEAFELGGVEECRRMLERKQDEWKQIPLNIAVIGNSGSGKSTFINAIRGLTADDEGAAEVGVKETTMEPRSYPHPNNERLKFWDLPGVGSLRFPRVTYLYDIGVDRYDFFLLITSTRFTENDAWLGEQFRQRNKKYFFIRTKIGGDISNNRKAHPRTHNEEAVVEDIRQSTAEHLSENGSEKVPVFLIDSYKKNKFEFARLESRLIEDFPKLKRSALILSLHATSKEIVRLKTAELRSRMWRTAALSGVVTAAVPVPGLSIAFDLAVVVQQYQFYSVQLGLDMTSLQRHANITSVNSAKLRWTVSERLGSHFITTDGAKELIEELCKHSGPRAAAVIEESSKYIPLIGPFVAGTLAFAGTYYALKVVLDKMENVALEVIMDAAETAATAEESDD